MPSIGVLTMELRLDESHSLKEKRHVVQSLKDRLRHKFNVSVAEIAPPGCLAAFHAGSGYGIERSRTRREGPARC